MACARTIALGILTVGVLALNAAAAAPVHVSLVGTPAAVVGHAWTAKLAVRPASFRGVVRVTATGPGRLDARATGGRGSYRVRLVFPADGRWTLTARAGGTTSRLGAVQVRPAATPLTFTWPTSVEAEPDGKLLVVENGAARVLRVDPENGSVTTLTSAIPKPYAVARAPDGHIWVSGGDVLWRLDPSGPVAVFDAKEDAGPLTVGADGDLFLATKTRVYRLPGGAGTPVVVASQLFGPHGLAVAADGALLVSDTANGRVLRVDPATGATTILSTPGEPRGLDVAADGTILVAEAQSHSIVRLAATGGRLDVVSAAFADPYDVDVAADGTVYVVDTAATGVIRRVARDGAVTTVSRR
jgi:sugar lactone lactonase YvrE